MQMMADTVCLQRKEPLGEQEHFQRCVERRVATDDRLQVAPGRIGQFRGLVVNAGEALGQRLLLLGGVGQGAANSMGEGATEIRLFDDGLPEDGGQRRLAIHGPFRLVAQGVPRGAGGMH